MTAKPAHPAAPADWLTRLRQRAPIWARLTRLDRPIGIYLLAWPTLWALWLAGAGDPGLKDVIVFLLGVVLMRSAGCVINDWADRAIDGQIARTQGRPLATGEATSREALGLCAALVALSASLLLFLPLAVFWWAFGALALAGVYPFMKRYTHLPQVVLGAAFAWAIPMAYVAVAGHPVKATWLLYCATVLWIVAYDTQYAMADRDDDLKLGVKSTAILFGELDLATIASLQGLFLFTLWLLGRQLALGWPFSLSLLAAAGLFAWQYRMTANREPARCTAAFLHNHWVGGVIFAGVFFSGFLPAV